MWLANLVCVAMMQVWANANVMSLGKIWWALAVSSLESNVHQRRVLILTRPCAFIFQAFMGTQVITGVARFQSKTGIWKMLRAEGFRREVAG